MSIRAEVRGLKETQKAMDGIVKDLQGSPMLNAMRDATMLVTRSARQGAPVDTGRLRASIVPEVRRGVWSREVEGVVGSNVLYAPFMEFGTRPHWPPPGALARWARRHGMSEFVIMRTIALRGTRAHPYLIPALEDNEEKIARIFERALDRMVEKS